ncbi:MAG: hypothetical protein OIN66_07115 [Candidatus Methanoperedens sp.]|nr:hypothetical protein [Candidatus Methanoperedens sp.]
MAGADVVKKEGIPAEDGKYQFVQIETERGKIDCHYYEVKGATKGVIMVGGVGEAVSIRRQKVCIPAYANT